MCWRFNVRLINYCWRVDLWTIKGMSPGSSTITLFQIPAHHLIFLFDLFSLLQSLVPGYQLTKSDHKRTLNYSIISYNNIITNETEKDIKINGEWNQSAIGWTLYPLSYGYHIWWTGHLDTWLCILQDISTVETYQSQALYHAHHASTLVGSVHAIIIYW